MTLTERPFRDDADIRAMGDLVSRSWLAGRPLVQLTVGDIEWWGINHPEHDLRELGRLWFVGDTLVGWAWHDPPGAVDWYARSEVTAPILGAILDDLEERSAAAHRAGGLAPATLVWAMDADPIARATLEERGYAPDGNTLDHWIRRLPAGGGSALPEVQLPDGYRTAGTRWPEDLRARVAVHRSAFHPSRMTVSRYRLLAGKPHYAPERDRVVVARDGSFAAFANAWWDPLGRVGELEPVGVHPDHRGRGLGRAVCLDAMRTLADLGALECLVFSDGSNAASQALYGSLGAQAVTISRRYARTVSS